MQNVFDFLQQAAEFCAGGAVRPFADIQATRENFTIGDSISEPGIHDWQRYRRAERIRELPGGSRLPSIAGPENACIDVAASFPDLFDGLQKISSGPDFGCAGTQRDEGQGRSGRQSSGQFRRLVAVRQSRCTDSVRASG